MTDTKTTSQASMRVEKLLTKYAPFPACIIDGHGKVSIANSKIDEVFIYDGIKDANIYALTGIKYAAMADAAESDSALSVVRNNKNFKIHAKFLGSSKDPSILLSFVDITNYEKLKELYNQERMVMALVHIDNFDELAESVADDASLDVVSQIDKKIKNWAEKMQASVTKYKEYLYFVVLENHQYEKLVENKFSILDDVRAVETEGDFPVTLSIGVGVGGKTPEESDQYATDALDLALGRGGDQAVVKTVKKIEYYGGKMQTVEKGNKGKSRIIAHAMKQLIAQSSEVIIMGHKNPDMDAFGAALGIYRIAVTCEKEAYVVIDKYNEALTAIYKSARESEAYNFISPERAKKIIGCNTLLVVVDTNRPSIVECAELLGQTEKLVVIDHHRKAEDFIANPTLAYTEPYASSTSELVTEIVQYSGERKALTKFEAEALLAGITVDTNRFAVKTGVRTFEAASWLRRSGADTTEVKKYFQADMDMFKTRAKCIANAEFFGNGIAMSICPGRNINAQVVNSQVADELLTIAGIKASFVAGRDECGHTVVSARSLGEVNVQTIMEKFGGGGHLNTAGAQVELSPREALAKLTDMLNEIFKEEDKAEE